MSGGLEGGLGYFTELAGIANRNEESAFGVVGDRQASPKFKPRHVNFRTPSAFSLVIPPPRKPPLSSNQMIRVSSARSLLRQSRPTGTLLRASLTTLETQSKPTPWYVEQRPPVPKMVAERDSSPLAGPCKQNTSVGTIKLYIQIPFPCSARFATTSFRSTAIPSIAVHPTADISLPRTRLCSHISSSSKASSSTWVLPSTEGPTSKSWNGSRGRARYWT